MSWNVCQQLFVSGWDNELSLIKNTSNCGAYFVLLKGIMRDFKCCASHALLLNPHIFNRVNKDRSELRRTVLQKMLMNYSLYGLSQYLISKDSDL